MATERLHRRSVYIIGPQSTGKTTITNRIEASYDSAATIGSESMSRPHIVRETARRVIKQHGFTRDELRSSPSRALHMQKCILEAQLQAERAATANPATAWYLCDRSGLDTIVYAQLYAGKEAAEGLLASPAWTELEERMKAGIVFLCEAGCSWLVDDGTRLMPLDEREWMRVDATFRELLDARGINYTVVPKITEDLQERVELVKRALTGVVG
ncbi:hypothetical protein EJ04DRAFT_498986 [Polyplosphaeria fusca]|uniref:NadR/Ttd14 AAA domain-containing protein n=1 Tax=Polyplosphaeria fusca TaxID=682080 RepID=A0A9P4QUK0_9PLEO|nr:hypothetical protein EJ04DRAFT_498986 [Polyplosphaeria fusca]